MDNKIRKMTLKLRSIERDQQLIELNKRQRKGKLMNGRPLFDGRISGTKNPYFCKGSDSNQTTTGPIHEQISTSGFLR